MGALHVDKYTFFIISCSVLCRMRNVSDKNCRENQNTHFVFSIFFKKKRAFCKIMWKKYCRPGQATDDNMAHARLHAGYLRLQIYSQNM